MQERDLIDVVERAMRAAGHPEVTSVGQFDNGHTYGVKVTFEEGATCFVAVSDSAGKMLPPGGR
jgi:hypothetical protein